MSVVGAGPGGRPTVAVDELVERLAHPGLAGGVDVAAAAAAELVAGPRTGASRRSGNRRGRHRPRRWAGQSSRPRGPARGPDEDVHAVGPWGASPVRACVANLRLRHRLIGYARASKTDSSQSLDLQRGVGLPGAPRPGRRSTPQPRPAASRVRHGRAAEGRQEVRAVESSGEAGPARGGAPRHVGVRAMPRTRHQAADVSRPHNPPGTALRMLSQLNVRPISILRRYCSKLML